MFYRLRFKTVSSPFAFYRFLLIVCFQCSLMSPAVSSDSGGDSIQRRRIIDIDWCLLMVMLLSVHAQFFLLLALRYNHERRYHLNFFQFLYFVKPEQCIQWLLNNPTSHLPSYTFFFSVSPFLWPQGIIIHSWQQVGVDVSLTDSLFCGLLGRVKMAAASARGPTIRVLAGWRVWSWER